MATNDHEIENSVEERLDEDYPFIEQGAEPPGRFVNNIWQGQMGWRTRHGPAVVVWGLGRPNNASAVLFPDGSRGKVGFFLDHGFRRPSSGPRRWVYGTLDIEPDDAHFIDGAQPSYVPPLPSGKPDLEADLAQDAAFLNALKDDRFALAVYTVFVNRAFFKSNHESGWECGDRQAARIVAALRDLGESYLDYFVGSRLPGMWPEDRPARRKQLDEEVERASQPFSLDPSLPDIPLPARFADETGPRMIETPAQLDDLKRQFRARAEEMAPELERHHLERLARLKTALADFERNENADVYEMLRSHLTRLGWRTETDDDRARAECRALTTRVEVLRRIKALETLPETSTPSWAVPLAATVRDCAGGPIYIARQKASATLSEEEQEAYYAGDLVERLSRLAVAGCISKEEYDQLMSRLTF